MGFVILYFIFRILDLGFWIWKHALITQQVCRSDHDDDDDDADDKDDKDDEDDEVDEDVEYDEDVEDDEDDEDDGVRNKSQQTKSQCKKSQKKVLGFCLDIHHHDHLWWKGE